MVTIGGPLCARHLAEQDGVRVGDSEALRANGFAGLGVYATRDIAGGTPVLRYTCERVSADTLARRYGDDGHVFTYTMTDADGDMRDGAIDRRAAALINDATGLSDCENNLRPVQYDTETWVTFVATRDICAGEELLVPYGEAYWAAADGSQFHVETVEV